MGNLLVPFKKFFSNKNTITILGVLLGLVVLYFGYVWRVNQSVQPIDVPYATRTMIAGTKITAEDIGYTQIPKEFLSNMTNIVTDVGSIQNMLVSYDSKIAINSFFFSENLITEEEMPDSIFSNIPDGHTIFLLDVDAKATYANSIMPDNYIDLYMKAEVEEEGGNSSENLLVFARFIKQIQVLAVRDEKGKNVFIDKDNPLEPAALLFAVPEDLFLLLSKAKYLGDVELVPVPRNTAYTTEAGATEVQASILEQMIIEKTFIVPNECTDLTQC